MSSLSELLVPNVAMSGSEPGTPKARVKSTSKDVVCRTSNGHGRSTSTGSYGVNRLSFGSGSGGKDRKKMRKERISLKPDGSDSVSRLILFWMHYSCGSMSSKYILEHMRNMV